MQSVQWKRDQTAAALDGGIYLGIIHTQQAGLTS